MGVCTPDRLRTVDLFDDLSDDELERWSAATVCTRYTEGDLIVDHGEQPTGMYLLFEGTLRNVTYNGDREEPSGMQHAPTWFGAIAALTENPLVISVYADTDVEVGVIGIDAFLELTLANRSVHKRIMQQVAPVMGRITAMQQNRERLESLGTMAAGLAHELNNPAAAARRAAGEMAEAIVHVSTVVKHFVEAGIEREEAAKLVALQREAFERAEAMTPLSALDAADAEDELLDRLEDLGVADAHRQVEPLVAAGLDGEWIDRIVEHAGPAAPAVVDWVAHTLAANRLSQELCESTKRMSELVSAVKTYAYMDRGELVEVDLHEGLETTVTVLGHKLKHTQIAVQRDYDERLPKVSVLGSELNQVWTNLLDNAIAALGDTGTITLRTTCVPGGVTVVVEDDGPGIPDDVVEKIFDPFFTTKDVGQGTGLGLDAVRRIVVDRHRGRVTVDSAPGRTAFTVFLPKD